MSIRSDQVATIERCARETFKAWATDGEPGEKRITVEELIDFANDVRTVVLNQAIEAIEAAE